MTISSKNGGHWLGLDARRDLAHFNGRIGGGINDRPSWITVNGNDFPHLRLDRLNLSRGIRQKRLEFRNPFLKGASLIRESRRIKPRDLCEGHAGNGFRLGFAEVVTRANLRLGLGTVSSALKDSHNLRCVGSPDDQAKDHVEPFLRSGEVMGRATAQDVYLMVVVVDKQLDHPRLTRLPRRQHRLTEQEHHLHRDRKLEVGIPVQRIQHLDRIAITLHIEDDPHSLFSVRFVSNLGNEAIQPTVIEGLDDPCL